MLRKWAVQRSFAFMGFYAWTVRRVAEQVVWKGTPDEAERLAHSIDAWCHGQGEGQHCTFDSEGRRTGTCAAHMMLFDQRVMDWLLYTVRRVECMRREEFSAKRKK